MIIILKIMILPYSFQGIWSEELWIG